MISIMGRRGTNWHWGFERKVTAPNVPWLLANLGEVLAQFPKEEHFNLYFTANNTIGKEPRDWESQSIVPFDIDHIDVSRAEETARVTCEAIGTEFMKTGIICSGYGLQLFIEIEDKIVNAAYFDQNRELYKFICQRIAQALKEKNLPGKVDPTGFSFRKLLRLPGTMNVKEGRSDAPAYVIQGHMEGQGFRLDKACGAPDLGKSDSVAKEVWKRSPFVDQDTVQKECLFLKHSMANQRTLDEPQWYATLGIVGHFPDGKELAHAYSAQHPGYTKEETDFKVMMATKTTGPRTCKSIDAQWGGCNKCPHLGKITTPCQIKGEDFIETEKHGFYNLSVSTNGKETRSPAYEDLIKYYRKTKGKFFSPTRGAFYTYNKEQCHWETTEETDIRNFAYKNFSPVPRSSLINEFANTMSHAVYNSIGWMNETTQQKLNMKNGVLDLKDGRLYTHSEKYGFMSVLPYNYDEKAKCPKFDVFLSEVAEGDSQIVNLLYEFMGYALSGSEMRFQRALILLGSGANGKSTFNKVLKAMVGPGYFSTLNLKDLQNDQMRAQLEGKLFNIGEENSPKEMVDAAIFKTLTGGDYYTIKEVYKKPLSLRNRTKLIFNCNEMPYNTDTTEGYYRRLLIVPFRAKFKHGDEKTDPDIEYKLYTELPGILNKSLDAYKKIMHKNGFTEPDVSRKIVAELIEEQDDVGKWFSECISPAIPEKFVTTSALYSSYRSFCEREGIRYYKANIAFFMRLKECLSPQYMYKRAGTNNERRLYGAELRTGF